MLEHAHFIFLVSTFGVRSRVLEEKQNGHKGLVVLLYSKMDNAKFKFECLGTDHDEISVHSGYRI